LLKEVQNQSWIYSNF